MYSLHPVKLLDQNVADNYAEKVHMESLLSTTAYKYCSMLDWIGSL